jgi:hypothetical protein
VQLSSNDDAVWLQLLERCMSDPNCQRTAMCSLAQQLADQKARADTAAQQLSALHRVVADQRADIDALKQQLLQALLPQ